MAELIDFAASHNRETRVSWENAIARGEALGIARSELFPLLTAVAMSGAHRDEIPFGTQFYRQTVPAFQASLDLSYTIVDFGVRRGRIDAESWDDRNFVAAVEKTGRKKLVLCGLWTETCIALPTIQAIHDGYEVHIAEDCCGDVGQMAHGNAMRRVIPDTHRTRPPSPNS